MGYPDNIDFAAMDRACGIDLNDFTRVREIAEREYAGAIKAARAIERLRREIAEISSEPNSHIPNHYAGHPSVKPTTWADIDARLADAADELGVSDDEIFDLCRGRAGL